MKIKKLVLGKSNYFRINSWALDPLPDVQKELNWRLLTNTAPREVVFAGYDAYCEYVIEPSDLDRMFVVLPYDFCPSHYSWPVKNIDVSLVETQCYELELLTLCQEYRAESVTLYEHTLLPYEILPGVTSEVSV